MEITYLERRGTHALPDRPALPLGVPVLRRSADSAQLGIDPARAVVLDRVSAPVLAVLDELDGRHRLGELTGIVAERGGRADELLDLLGELAARGLLRDAADDTAPLPGWLAPDAAAWTLGTGRPGGPAVRARRSRTVLVDGGGRVGVAVACALAGSGVGIVRVRAHGRVRAEDIGTGYPAADLGRPRAAAARDAVARCTPAESPGRRRPEPLDGPVAADTAPADTGRDGSGRSGGERDRSGSGGGPAGAPRGRRPTADLVVLADTLSPDPVLAAALVADGVMHLPVQAHAGRGSVGPLVLPARSSCLRCVDLARTADDPRWPAVAAQLSCRAQQADLCSTLAVAALAAGQVMHALGWADAARWPPSSWGATVELDSLRGTLSRTEWRPRPDCGCGAA